MILAAVLCWTSGSLLAQGIQFVNTDFEKLLLLARQQNKLAFVEVHLNGCPHCEALAPVMMEKKVGDYYNPRFVSLKVEANSAVSKAIQEKQHLHYPQFPLLFYFDTDGKLLHQATPADKPTRSEFIEEVIRHATNALSPATRTSGYAARYASGERNLEFMINFANYAKTTRDTTQLEVLNGDFGRMFVQPSDLESPVGFYILSRFIQDFQHPMAVYFFNHLNTYRTRHGAREVQQAGESILFQTLYGQRTYTLSSAEVASLRTTMEALGTPAPVAAMRTILKELEAYFRENNTRAAAERFNEYRKQGTLTLQDYAYLTRFFNEKAPDHTYAGALVQWTGEVLASLKPNERNKPEVAELYREQSEALRRLGRQAEGKKAAETALSIARAIKEPLSSYQQQAGKF